MRKNDVVTLEIEEINNLGCGVGHLAVPDGSRGLVVFVQGAVTGDTVEARIIKVNKSYLVGRIERILKPSPYRYNGEDCGARGCGGCIYRHVQYEHELEIKREYVRSAFRKAGLADVEIEAVRTTNALTAYRNKAQYPVQNGKNGMEYGFFAGSTHRIVPVSKCLLQPAIFTEIADFVCRFCDENGITAYNEETGSGFLRHIYLRQGQATGEIMLCLVANGKSFSAEEAFASSVIARFPEIKSIYLNTNTKSTNVVLGDQYRRLAGKSEIEDVLCGLRFAIAPAAFYQVNHDACELLYGIAKEKAGLTGGEILLDLYCGIGTIGLSMADRAGEIVGIEIVEAAVKCARENAARNGVENAYFYCGDASDAKGLLANAERLHGSVEGATVIMDPPRKGSTPELIEYLAARNFQKIVYVSCNPDTLARDCVLFRHLGYEIGAVTPVDMFPRTGHVESVVCLKRQIQQ